MGRTLCLLQHSRLAHYWLVPVVLAVVTAGFLVGLGTMYVRPWSVVVVEQDADQGRAVSVPGIQYRVSYQVQTNKGLSDPRTDVDVQPVGCGQILIRTPILLGAKEVIFSLASDSPGQVEAYRCDDDAKMLLQDDGSTTSLIMAFQSATEFPLRRWRSPNSKMSK